MAQKSTRKAVRHVQTRAKKRSKRRRRTLVIVVEVLALVLIAGAAYVMAQYSKFNTVTINAADIEINEGVETDGFQTLALFGVDSRTGDINSDTQTDTIILASINNQTKEIRLASVYRDTLMRMADGTLNKANSAYVLGGPAASLSMLNRNLDLDVTEYVTVDFASLADCIDLLGGIEIELSDEEAAALNEYVGETASVAGKEAHKLDGGGTYNLDGTQAVTYARIRKLIGSDYKRTERQRLVLEKMFEKVKDTNLGTLNDIIDVVFPQVSTNITFSRIVSLAGGLSSYTFGDTCGFPYLVEDQIYYHNASVVIPVDLTRNVAALHEFLYGETDYVPSLTVQEIATQIEDETGVYPMYYEDELAMTFGSEEEPEEETEPEAESDP